MIVVLRWSFSISNSVKPLIRSGSKNYCLISSLLLAYFLREAFLLIPLVEELPVLEAIWIYENK